MKPEAVIEHAPQPLKAERGDLAALAIITAAIALFFLPILSPHTIYFYRDVMYDTYPFSLLVQQYLEARTLPLWQPFIGFGQPMLANPMVELIYPTTLLRLFLSPPAAFKWHVIVHAWWSACGLFLFCRALSLSRLAALMAGLGFAFAGPQVSNQNYHVLIASASWLPWALLTLERAITAWSWRRALLFGGVLALQLCAGEKVTCLQTLFFCSIYALAVHVNWRNLRTVVNGQIIRTFLAGGLCAFLLSAIYLLPFLGYVALGRRGVGLTSLEANQQSLHPMLLADLIVPQLFLTDPPLGPADLSPWIRAFNPGFAPFIFCIYLGATQCVLALLGGARRSRRTLCFAAVGALALLLALGSHLGLFDLFRLVIPFFRVVRYPQKFLFIVSLCVSVLAAYGIDRLRSADNDEQFARMRPGLVLAVMLPLLLLVPTLYISALPEQAYESLLALAQRYELADYTEATEGVWSIARDRLLRSLLVMLPLLAVPLLRKKSYWPMVPVMVVAIAVIELAMANATVHPVAAAQVASYRPEFINYFPEPRSDYRVYGNEGRSGGAVPTLRDGGQQETIIYGRNQLVPYDNISYGLRTGIDGDKAGLYPQEYLQLQDYFSRPELAADQLLRLLARTNHRFTLSQQDLGPLPGLKLVGASDNGSIEPTRVYEIEGWQPLVFVVARARRLPAGEATLDLMAAADFNYREEVILNDAGAPLIDSGGGPVGTTSLIENSLRSVVIDAQMARSGYLVVQNHYLPGWRVKVDGRTVPVYRANQLFMALPLEAGAHRVEFSYLPWEVIAGALLTLIGVVVAIVICLPRRHREDLAHAQEARG